MVIAGDRQHMVAINHPDYLKYMMCFDANGSRPWTVKRTTGIQPVASHIELRTVASAKVFDKLFPNQPTPDEDNSAHQEHIFGGRGGNTRHQNELHKFG